MCTIHGREALHSMERSLHGIGQARQASRSGLIMLPLLHLHRMNMISEEKIASLTHMSLPGWHKDWASRPPASGRRLSLQQALHARRGEADYFMMN